MKYNDPWGVRKTDNQLAYKGQEKVSWPLATYRCGET